MQVWSFPSDSELADLIVNDPSWLLQRIVGKLFAPWLTGSDRIAFKDGRATVAEVKKVLDTDQAMPGNGHRICKMLLKIGLFVLHGEEILAPSIMNFPKSLLGEQQRVFK